MKIKYILIMAVLCLTFILQACGKVSNETGAGQTPKPVTFWTTIVGQIPVREKQVNEEFSLTPSDNTMIVSLGLINKDGGQTLLAWGKGMREKNPSASATGRTVNDYKSVAYNVDGAIITKSAPDDILVKWVKGNPEKWEYYIQLDNMDNATYVVNYMNKDGSRFSSIALDGKHTSENISVEFPVPSSQSTLWSRIYLSDESKNIVKKSILTIDEIKSKYEKIYKSFKYVPADLRIKKFSVNNPKINYPSDESLEFYLSEILINHKRGSNYLVSYLNEIPKDIIPTATISVIRDSLK